jgi:hypothetical protein
MADQNQPQAHQEAPKAGQTERLLGMIYSKQTLLKLLKDPPPLVRGKKTIRLIKRVPPGDPEGKSLLRVQKGST